MKIKPSSHFSLLTHFRRYSLYGLVITLTVLPVTAAIVTWNGDGGDGSVSSSNASPGANWVGGAVPASGSDLQFGAETVNGVGVVVFDAGSVFNVNSIAFTAAAPAYTVTAGSGSDVPNIATSITNSSSVKQTFSNITLNVAAAGQTWDGGIKGLDISSIDLGQNRTLTLTGTGIGTNGNTIGQVLTGTGTSGIIKSGTGTLTINTPSNLHNDFTGATTVTGGSLILNGANFGTGAYTVDGATSALQLGVNNRIADASAITLQNGGRFVLSNKSETLSALTVGVGGGIIDFGAGAGTNSLTLADSSLINWSGQLKILNFDAGDTLKFGTSNITLTVAQLANISFQNGTGTNNLGNQTGAINASGIVTPTTVPEPTSILLIGMGSIALIARRKRRLC